MIIWNVGVYVFYLTCFHRSNPVTLVTPNMLNTADPTIVPIPMSPFVTKEPEKMKGSVIFVTHISLQNPTTHYQIKNIYVFEFDRSGK